MRDYGTARWEGGDPECDHRVGRFEYPVSDKQASNNGSAGHQARDTCPKCGAIRIDEQIGLEQTPEEYVANLVAVFREVRRVLRDDGVLFLNLGDSYATHRNDHVSGGFGDNTVDCHSTIAKQGNFIPQGYKAKDLLGIPWRVAFALQADGWWLRSDIIWAKPNPMPESVKDRPTKAHEYVFLLTKSSRYYWDQDAVREDLQEKPHAPGNKPKFGEVKRNDFGTDRMQAIWGNPAGRNVRTVWNIATAPSNFSKETSHHRRVVRDEVSDGMICIPSPDCRLHEGLAAQVARGFCDEPEGDLIAHIECIYNRLFQEQRLGCAPIRQPIVSDLEEQNLDCSPLAYSPLAIDHNNEIHRMALSLDSNCAYIPFFEILSRIDDKRALLVSFVRHLCIYGSSMVVDDFSEHLLPRIPHHIVDTSFAQALKASETPCTCLYYEHYTRKSDHFATWPPKLVEPMIKAGSSEKGCCPVCGKAWTRLVEHKNMVIDRSDRTHEFVQTRASGTMLEPAITKTLGWQPACDHNAEPVPCVVLDPFAGSGTTLMVARQLVRHAVGLDLSYTYLHDQARKRLELDKLSSWTGK